MSSLSVCRRRRRASSSAGRPLAATDRRPFAVFRNVLLGERPATRAGQGPAERQLRADVSRPLQGTEGRGAALQNRNAPPVPDLQVQKPAAGNVLPQLHVELSTEEKHGTITPTTTAPPVTNDLLFVLPGPLATITRLGWPNYGVHFFFFF